MPITSENKKTEKAKTNNVPNEEQVIFDTMKEFFKGHAPLGTFKTDIKDVGYPLKRYRINWWVNSETKGAYISLSYYVHVSIPLDTASCTASMILSYPVQRHRFPASPSLISSTVGVGLVMRR